MTELYSRPSVLLTEPLLDWDEVLRRRERTRMGLDRLKAAIREMDRLIEEFECQGK